MRIVILATWAMLQFTSPDPGSSASVRLEAQRGSLLDGWTAARIYNSASAADSLVFLRAPGDTQTVYVSVTTSASVPYGWRRGGQAVRVRPQGCPEWSNYVCVAAGVPDTLYTDGRQWARPVSGVVRFVRAFSDTALDIFEGPGPIDCYEGAMLRGNWRAYLCTWSPRWALKGSWQVCP